MQPSAVDVKLQDGYCRALRHEGAAEQYWDRKKMECGIWNACRRGSDSTNSARLQLACASGHADRDSRCAWICRQRRVHDSTLAAKEMTRGGPRKKRRRWTAALHRGCGASV